jgi:hypothetical protein
VVFPPGKYFIVNIAAWASLISRIRPTIIAKGILKGQIMPSTRAVKSPNIPVNTAEQVTGP